MFKNVTDVRKRSTPTTYLYRVLHFYFSTRNEEIIVKKLYYLEPNLGYIKIFLIIFIVEINLKKNYKLYQMYDYSGRNQIETLV